MTMAVAQSVHNVFHESRRRSALALLAGAVVMEVLIQQQIVKFYWTPLIVGLAYLAAAIIGARRGTLWAPGIVTTCWGIAVLLGIHGVITMDAALSYDIAGAIGVLIVLAFGRFTLTAAAGPVGLVVSYGAILVHNYAHVPSWVFHGATFAVLLGAWALWELRPSTAQSVDTSANSSAPETEPDGTTSVRATATRV